MKRCISLILIATIVLSFAGCKFIVYEDTNGDEDFSLQTITNADITSFRSSCSQIMSSTVKVNNKTTYTTKEMSGVLKLLEINANNTDLEIVVSSSTEKGNARLVLVIDDTIVHDFDLNEDDQQFALKDIKGKVYLKLAGESAECKITYTIA